MVKNPLDNAEDIRDKGLIPGSVRSLRAGQGNPLSILAWRIPLDRKAWHVIVHIVEKTWTRFKGLIIIYAMVNIWAIILFCYFLYQSLPY